MKRKDKASPLDSPQWLSESTVSAQAAPVAQQASGSVSASPGPPPPPGGVSLTVSPGILCCGAGKAITATAKATGPNAKNKDVTLIWPGGTLTKKGSVTKTYTVKKTDCGTILEFTGTANGQTKTEKVPVVKLTTKTWAMVPTNTDRKKLGVGEDDFITVTPNIGTITWNLVGKGNLNPTEGDHSLFTAPERKGPATVKVTMTTTAAVTVVPKSITCSVTFTIVEPIEIKMVPYPIATGDWHRNGWTSAGFCAEVHILPEDVCFYHIFVIEDTCFATTNGYLAKHIPEANKWHQRWPSAISVRQGTQEHPSIMDGFDRVATGVLWVPKEKETGLFLWKIPWLYHVALGAEHKFTTANHRAVNTSTGKLTQTKAGAKAVKNVADPDSVTGCCAIP